MERARTLRPSPALIVAMIALVAAMSGAAVALPGKRTVGSGDIKDGAVGSKQIAAKAVKGSDVGEDALKGKQIFEQKLEAVPEAETAQTVRPFGDSFERVEPYVAAGLEATRAAAPKVPLASQGDLSIYAKCFIVTGGAGGIFGEVYAETATDGAILDATDASLDGDSGFLDVATPEAERTLLAIATPTQARFGRGDFYAMAPDGTGIGGRVAVAVKREPNGPDGVYGDESVCLFGGEAIG